MNSLRLHIGPVMSSIVTVWWMCPLQKDLTITHHADNSLASFCKWQQTINPKDEKHPNHHDVAILLTR